MATGGMKDFYKQRKNSGISKASKVTKKSSSTKSKSPTLISHGSPDLKDDYDDVENVLKQFDMNMAYGPCLGMTRIARWERACNLGLNPPRDIGTLLKDGKVQLECLWGGRV